jgi:hypothetical protein
MADDADSRKGPRRPGQKITLGDVLDMLADVRVRRLARLVVVRSLPRSSRKRAAMTLGSFSSGRRRQSQPNPSEARLANMRLASSTG